MTEGTDAGAETLVADDAGQATADTSGQTVVTAFGQTMKTLRVRASLEREDFGRRIRYSASTVASCASTVHPIAGSPIARVARLRGKVG
ncbi:hypothetical protein [Streptomyces sp. G45]|uniref:hypothetical protein n=1 Tax=Streptomyces sp. G45 TaxID=3406627 RepID=UPI003C2363D5